MEIEGGVVRLLDPHGAFDSPTPAFSSISTPLVQDSRSSNNSLPNASPKASMRDSRITTSCIDDDGEAGSASAEYVLWTWVISLEWECECELRIGGKRNGSESSTRDLGWCRFHPPRRFPLLNNNRKAG